MVVSWWWHGGVKVVSWWCHGGVKVVSGWCHGGVRLVSGLCHGGVMVVSRWCQGGDLPPSEWPHSEYFRNGMALRYLDTRGRQNLGQSAPPAEVIVTVSLYARIVPPSEEHI